MEIKQLKELLKLLRSQGVLQYQSADLNLVLSEHFQPPTRRLTEAHMPEVEEELSPEEEAERMLYYSALGPTQEDTEN
jgi:hypothetical protein